MKIITSRRVFFSNLGFGLAVLPALSFIKTTAAWAAEVIYKEADLATTKKNPSIAALKYVDDATKSTDRKVEKMGVAADKQTCANCNFYKEPGILEGKEKAPVGKCLMLANQVVHAAGWCAVWAKVV